MGTTKSRRTSSRRTHVRRRSASPVGVRQSGPAGCAQSRDGRSGRARQRDGRSAREARRRHRWFARRCRIHRRDPRRREIAAPVLWSSRDRGSCSNACARSVQRSAEGGASGSPPRRCSAPRIAGRRHRQDTTLAHRIRAARARWRRSAAHPAAHVLAPRIARDDPARAARDAAAPTCRGRARFTRSARACCACTRSRSGSIRRSRCSIAATRPT